MLSFLFFLFVVFLLLALYAYIFIPRPLPGISHWYHHFEGVQFSANDFYAKVHEEVAARQMQKVSFSEWKHFEKGVFSAMRLYLRIEYEQYFVDVCCAPFGNGCYTSWWVAERPPGIIAQIPVINTLAGKNPKYQSYHQVDTALMFKSAVHDVVLAVINGISTTQGIRPLTELERQPSDLIKIMI